MECPDPPAERHHLIRLPAGGKRIRTLGPRYMDDAFETILVAWFAFAFLPERPTRSQGGTDGSNPLSSGSESTSLAEFARPAPPLQNRRDHLHPPENARIEGDRQFESRSLHRRVRSHQCPAAQPIQNPTPCGGLRVGWDVIGGQASREPRAPWPFFSVGL